MKHVNHAVISVLALAACAAEPPTTSPSVSTAPGILDQARASSDLLDRIDALTADGWAVADWAKATVEDAKGEPALALAIRKSTISADLVFSHGDTGEELVVIRPAAGSDAGAVVASLRSVSLRPGFTPQTTGAWSCEYPRYRGWAGVCQSDWNYFGEYQYYQYEYGYGDALNVSAGGCGWACPDRLIEASLWLVCGEWGRC